MKISDKIIKRLNGVGYNLKNTIGHGEYGYIYDIGNNKALKITSDFSEAASVNKICNKQLKNVCRIYRVFRFEKVKLYFIEQEKLKPIDIIPFTGHLNTENFTENYNYVEKNFELIKKVLPLKIQKLSKEKLIYAMCFYFSTLC